MAIKGLGPTADARPADDAGGVHYEAHVRAGLKAGMTLEAATAAADALYGGRAALDLEAAGVPVGALGVFVRTQGGGPLVDDLTGQPMDALSLGERYRRMGMPHTETSTSNAQTRSSPGVAFQKRNLEDGALPLLSERLSVLCVRLSEVHGALAFQNEGLWGPRPGDAGGLSNTPLPGIIDVLHRQVAAAGEWLDKIEHELGEVERLGRFNPQPPATEAPQSSMPPRREPGR